MSAWGKVLGLIQQFLEAGNVTEVRVPWKVRQTKRIETKAVMNIRSQFMYPKLFLHALHFCLLLPSLRLLLSLCLLSPFSRSPALSVTSVGMLLLQALVLRTSRYICVCVVVDAVCVKESELISVSFVLQCCCLHVVALVIMATAVAIVVAAVFVIVRVCGANLQVSRLNREKKKNKQEKVGTANVERKGRDKGKHTDTRKQLTYPLSKQLLYWSRKPGLQQEIQDAWSAHVCECVWWCVCVGGELMRVYWCACTIRSRIHEWSMHTFPKEMQLWNLQFRTHRPLVNESNINRPEFTITITMCLPISLSLSLAAIGCL